MKISETFWLTVVGQFQNLGILIGVILFLIIPRQGRRQFVELGLILIVPLITETIAWIGILVFHTNMNLAPNILRLVNLPLVILLYRSQISWRNKNATAYILIAAFVVFALINLFFIQGPHGINSYTSSLASFCIVIMSMTYLFAHAPQLPAESGAKPPMYWINAAFLFYYCTTFFINLWVDYLVNVLQSNLIEIWTVHNCLGVFFYAMLCYALILIRAQYKTASIPTLGENLR